MTDTDLSINTNAITFLADPDMFKTDTNISVSANRYIGISLVGTNYKKLKSEEAS